jgi:hypothetical protein
MILSRGTLQAQIESPPAATETPLTTGKKAAVFGERTIAPSAFAKSAFTAGIAQWRNSPEEWEQGMAGYGRRFGHKIANRGIENAIGFLVAAPLHEDPRYFHAGNGGMWRRIGHALEYTLLTRNDEGHMEVSIWRLAGNYGAQFVSNAWRPERYSNVSDTLMRGTLSIGFDAATNVFKEFWPDIRRVFPGK